MTSTTIDGDAVARREFSTLSIISAVHLLSHYYWLALVPLLPSLTVLLGVSYLELGVAITVMNAVSAATQAPTGFLVDRHGPRLLLILGIATGAAGFILLALVPTYVALLAAAALIGLGNAVYHPADYSILAAEMRQERMGRAFSIHTFMGYLGFAVAPPIIFGLVWLGGPRFALAATGVIGLLTALLLIPGLMQERQAARSRPAAKAGQGTSARDLITALVVTMTLMYTFVNLATGMMQTYMVAAVSDLLTLPEAVGNLALTTFFIALVAGVLAGGVVADRVRAKAHVALGGFGAAALFVVAIPILKPGAVATIFLIGATAFCAGIIMPSRDLLVRKAAPADAVGRVFGIVTTGFNFGGIIAPLIGGALIDWRLTAWIFYGSAAFMILTIVVALSVERQANAKNAVDKTNSIDKAT